MIIEGDYQRDGAVCVRQAFTAEHVAMATEAIEANLADLSPMAKRASADDDGAFIEDFRSWDRIPAIEAFIRYSPAAKIAAELTGSSTIRLYHDHMLVKEPGTRQRTPWHQDQPYYNVDGSQNASMWFPVDPVPGPQPWSSSLAHIGARGSCLGPFSMNKPSGFLKEAWPRCPTLLPTQNGGRSSAGSSNRAMPSSSTWWPCMAQLASMAPIAGGCCPCVSWATTWSMHLADGPRHHRFPA